MFRNALLFLALAASACTVSGGVLTIEDKDAAVDSDAPDTDDTAADTDGTGIPPVADTAPGETDTDTDVADTVETDVVDTEVADTEPVDTTPPADTEPPVDTDTVDTETEVADTLETDVDLSTVDADHDGIMADVDCDDFDNDPADSLPRTWYRDVDGDGRGDTSDSASACTVPAGFVRIGGDCDDRDDDVRPGIPEDCGDADDNDCDDVADADEALCATAPVDIDDTTPPADTVETDLVDTDDTDVLDTTDTDGDTVLPPVETDTLPPADTGSADSADTDTGETGDTAGTDTTDDTTPPDDTTPVETDVVDTDDTTPPDDTTPVETDVVDTDDTTDTEDTTPPADTDVLVETDDTVETETEEPVVYEDAVEDLACEGEDHAADACIVDVDNDGHPETLLMSAGSWPSDVREEPVTAFLYENVLGCWTGPTPTPDNVAHANSAGYYVVNFLGLEACSTQMSVFDTEGGDHWWRNYDLCMSGDDLANMLCVVTADHGTYFDFLLALDWDGFDLEANGGL